MRGKAAPQKRPASPMNDSDESSAAQTTKKRRVRRPALSNDEDIAILRAVLVVQPYRASWGQGRQKWLETAARVAQDTGGEMSDDLCKGRYVNLLKRFTTPQEERKRPWPKDDELKALLEEAVAEQTKYEEEVKDEFDEKGNQRRKWQPLLAMRKEKGEAVDASPARKGAAAQKGGRKTRGADEDEDEDDERPRSGAAEPQDTNRRPTRWTAPTPGARAPVLGAPPAIVSSASAASASAQASALASRAVASATNSRATSSPVRPVQAPASSTATPASQPASLSLSTAAITVSAPMSRSNPVVLPGLLRDKGPSREMILPPGRQQQLPTPPPWLRPAGVVRDAPLTGADAFRSTTAATRAPTPPTSTPPRESKPDVSSSSSASAPRPSSASPRDQPLLDRSRIERGYSTYRDNTRQSQEDAGRQQVPGAGSLQKRPETMNSAPQRTPTPTRQPPVHQPPPQMPIPHRLGMAQAPGRFSLSQSRYSPPIQPPPPVAPVLATAGRNSTQSTPPRSAPVSQATTSAPSATTNSATPARDSNNSSLSRGQASENRTSSPSVPRVNGSTGVESMLLCVLDRLTDMEKARLEDTREERELKKRELEMGASRNRSGPGASPGSANLRHELEELSRTTASLSTSFAVSRQEQQELQMEVSRLAPFLQASQRERAQLQQDVSLLMTQVKTANRERDDLKSDLAAVVKTVSLLQSALLQQDEAFDNYKRTEALERRREFDLQQEMVTRQLEQFQDALQVDRRKREEVLALIQKERDLNEAQHRERLRQLDARGGGSSKSRNAAADTPVPASVEAELAELRVAIDVERSEREREYTNLLQNIKQILAADASG